MDSQPPPKKRVNTLAQQVKGTKNRSILSSEFSQKSGMGTDVFSLYGKRTIHMYKAFQEENMKNDKLF